MPPGPGEHHGRTSRGVDGDRCQYPLNRRPDWDGGASCAFSHRCSSPQSFLPVADRANERQRRLSSTRSSGPRLHVSEPETDAASVEGAGPIVDASLADALVAVDGVTYQHADPPVPVEYEELKLPPEAPVVLRRRIRRSHDGHLRWSAHRTARTRRSSRTKSSTASSTATSASCGTPRPPVTARVRGHEHVRAAMGRPGRRVRHGRHQRHRRPDPLAVVVGRPAVDRGKILGDRTLRRRPRRRPARNLTARRLRHPIIAGELNERFADLPAYWYWDQPRSVLLEGLDRQGHITAHAKTSGCRSS